MGPSSAGANAEMVRGSQGSSGTVKRNAVIIETNIVPNTTMVLSPM